METKEQNKISSNLVLAAVSSEQEHWQKTWTTCRCGKNVMLKENNMGWLVHNCQCGIQIRMNASRSSMIIEPINDVNRNCG